MMLLVISHRVALSVLAIKKCLGHGYFELGLQGVGRPVQCDIVGPRRRSAVSTLRSVAK